jgi:hypothetical protein
MFHGCNLLSHLAGIGKPILHFLDCLFGQQGIERDRPVVEKVRPVVEYGWATNLGEPNHYERGVRRVLNRSAPLLQSGDDCGRKRLLKQRRRA